jgi:ERCC4-type nuclease
VLFVASTEPELIKTMAWHEPANVITMVTGDIMLIQSTKMMLIERKGTPDLLNSMADGSLVEQISRLVEATKFPLLLTHGSLLCNKDGKVVANGQTHGWNWWALQMQLVSLQAGGCMHLHLNATKEIPEAIKHLSNWLSRNDHLRVYRKERIPFLMPFRGLEVLAALPGIGVKRAKDCLDFYGGTGRAIAELTCIDKCFLPAGVAGGTVSKIREELSLGENERLKVVDDRIWEDKND